MTFDLWAGRASSVTNRSMDGMPEPPRRAPDDDSQSLEATVEHLLELEEAARERGDLDRADQLHMIGKAYRAWIDSPERAEERRAGETAVGQDTDGDGFPPV